MRLEKNNNGGIIWRVAVSNLSGRRLYSFFSAFTIFLSIIFVSTLVLFLTGEQTAKYRMVSSMQHVMFMNSDEEQMRRLAEDERTEILLPYKFSDLEFETDGVEYHFFYLVSNTDKLFTYVPEEGRVPEKYDEIVVDKQFMEDMGGGLGLGSVVSLELGGERQDFTICGYTDKKYGHSLHPIYVSREFAEQSPVLGGTPYTALLRINGALDMNATEFDTAVYQMASDYGIERQDVNTNGAFEEYLRAGNAGLYTLIAVSILVLSAAAIVIYSIFYLSVESRVREIGQLQTIGMTRKQLRRMIRTEGLLLCGAALPPGLILSGILAYFFQPAGWSFGYFGTAALAIGLLEILVVQFSIGKPAAIASGVSPIEAAGNYGAAEKPDGKWRHRTLTPFRLAVMEAGRSRKKWGLTTLSLAMGGVIFMTAVTFIASWDEENYSRQDRFANAELEISYLYNAHSNPQTYGPTDLQLTGHLSGELQERLQKLPCVKKLETLHSAFGVVEYQEVVFGQQFAPLSEDSAEYFKLEAEGNHTYSYLAEHDAVLVTHADFLEKFYGLRFQPGDKLTLHWFDGEEHTAELEIAAVSGEQASNEIDASFFLADTTMKKLWSEMNTVSSIRLSIDNYDKNGLQAEADIRKIVDEYPDLILHTLRERMEEDSLYAKQLNVQIYGISALVIIFSLFNLINTVISGISTRKRELSMLESIGMEERQLRHMLYWEGLLIALPNILLTLTAGTAAGAITVAFMDSMADYMEYSFPFIAAALYTVGMAVIPALISSLCLKLQGGGFSFSKLTRQRK